MGVYALKILGWGQPGPCPYVGEYVLECAFEAHHGRGRINTTRWSRKAMHFPDIASALNYRNTSPKCKPRRDDGRPNRPLTAYDMQIVRLL